MSNTITNDSTHSNAVNAIALSVGFGGFVTDEDANLIAQFGASKDAAVVFGQNGEFALQERHYGFDGSKIIRYRPDPRDFHSPQDWLLLIKEGTATVC